MAEKTFHYLGGSEPDRTDAGDYFVTYVAPNGARTVIADTKSWSEAKSAAERHNTTSDRIRWDDMLGDMTDGVMHHAAGKYEVRPR